MSKSNILSWSFTGVEKLNVRADFSSYRITMYFTSLNYSDYSDLLLGIVLYNFAPQRV
jgi:hypothetical protein